MTAPTPRLTVGDQAMQQAVTDGWIKTFEPDGRYRGYAVTFTRKYQTAFKAFFGYSAGRSAYVGTSFEFWATVQELEGSHDQQTGA